MKKKPTIYVAVVCKVGVPSQRTDGDWASFTGTDKKTVVERAVKARAKWEINGYGPYEILVGELAKQVFLPEFELVKIDTTPKKAAILSAFDKGLKQLYAPAIKEALSR